MADCSFVSNVRALSGVFALVCDLEACLMEGFSCTWLHAHLFGIEGLQHDHVSIQDYDVVLSWLCVSVPAEDGHRLVDATAHHTMLLTFVRQRNMAMKSNMSCISIRCLDTI